MPMGVKLELVTSVVGTLDGPIGPQSPPFLKGGKSEYREPILRLMAGCLSHRIYPGCIAEFVKCSNQDAAYTYKRRK